MSLVPVDCLGVVSSPGTPCTSCPVHPGHCHRQLAGQAHRLPCVTQGDLEDRLDTLGLEIDRLGKEGIHILSPVNLNLEFVMKNMKNGRDTTNALMKILS